MPHHERLALLREHRRLTKYVSAILEETGQIDRQLPELKRLLEIDQQLANA